MSHHIASPSSALLLLSAHLSKNNVNECTIGHNSISGIRVHPTVVHAIGLPCGKMLLTERTDNTLVVDMLRFHMIRHILPLL
jgi:hypothetical protein